MKPSRIIFRSLCYHWRVHAGVLAGAMLATAILTGALLVGNSVDHSLRKFAMLRLGGIHFAMDTRGRVFSDKLATALDKEVDTQLATALKLRGMAINQRDDGEKVQVNQVQVIGVGNEFWDFAPSAEIELNGDEVALNDKLALALDVSEGDEIALRVSRPGVMSRDAPLSSRSDSQTKRALFQVKAIVGGEQLGRFGLTSNQTVPYNAFVNLKHLQEQMDLGGQANLLLVGDGVSSDELDEATKRVWTPELSGLNLRRHASGVLQLESERIFFDSETARAALSLTEAQGTFTYLVNGLASDGGATPYSFVVAGPIPTEMKDDEIVINSWLAGQLNADVGDRVRMTYSELLASNKFTEKERSFTVRAVRDMDDLKVERALMPSFPGLSDVESCRDWDVGMPMDEALLQDEANEEYWKQYGQTPKAFVTLQAGQDMWANRFGDLTAVRYPAESGDEEQIRKDLRAAIDPTQTGMFFLPVREQALNAVDEAMDLGGLFLGMSFFLILSALVFTGLLFVFGVQRRSTEMGTLLAVGFSHRQIAMLFGCEAGAIALVGAIIGAVCGTVYTRALIFGLTKYWGGAVASLAIQYHSDSGSVFLGAAISFVCSLLAMVIAMWRQTRCSPRELLAGDFLQGPIRARRVSRRRAVLAFSISALALSVVLVAYAGLAEVENITLPFFAVGTLLLLSGVGFFRCVLGRLDRNTSSEGMTLRTLAVQNLARRPARSLSVAGLLASGCFLVFAVSSMQEDVTKHAHERSSGTGGFELFAEATVPILEDLTEALGVSGVESVRLRVSDGDDAGCLNLNQAQNPRLLGVNVDELASLGAFVSEKENVWDLLAPDVLEDGAIPALVGDSDTAMWGLKMKTGLKDGGVLTYQNEAGASVRIRLVGTLPMRLSVFQGTVLISDRAFTRLYPSEEGFRMFLIDSPPNEEKSISSRLTSKFDRAGLDVVPAVQRLREFYAVQSAYLAMFLVLGGLGLALGTAGMAIVALRNLLERRSEIALLMALGYDRGVVYRVLMLEHGLLLVTGLGIGAFAAFVSMIPAVFVSESTVSLSTQAGLFALVLAGAVGGMAVALFAGLPKDNIAALRSE